MAIMRTKTKTEQRREPSRAQRRRRAAARVRKGERERAGEDKAWQLDFERLLSELSARFINLPASDVDREIMDAERQICDLLQLDTSALWQWSDESPGCFMLTHFYSSQDGPQLDTGLTDEDFPWIRQQMLAGRILAVRSLEDLPAGRDREVCRQIGVKSSLNLPLSAGGGRPFGVLGLTTRQAERDWPDALVKRLQLVAQIFANALARKRADQALRQSQDRLRIAAEELEDRLKFENLISDLSARMVVTASDDVDQEIDRALDTLLRFFRCERCGFLEVIREEDAVRITHARYAEGVEEVSKTLNLSSPFPWAVRRMTEQGQHVAFSSVDELPAEAAVDRASWVGMGTKSSLNIPIFSAGSVRHLMVIHSIREERRWPESYIPRLRVLGEIFANAVQRRRSDRALRESEERLNLAAEAAESGLWVLDVRTNVFWITEKSREIFGYPHGQALRIDAFQASVHSADWERVQHAIERALKAGEAVNLEYRITRGDGCERWIASRGRPQFDAAGRPERLMGISVDITERKQTEKALRASEARLAAAADLAGLGHYEVDYGAGTCFLDSQFRQICGVPGGVRDGLAPVLFWQEHVHPDDWPLVVNQRQKLHQENFGQISIEYRYLHPVLGTRWIHHHARTADLPSGGGVRTFGVIRDITDTRKIADQLEEDSRYGTMIAGLSSKFVNLPPGEVDGGIEDAQRRVCEFLGLDLSALWQAVEDIPGEYRLTHHYRCMDGPLITRMSARDNFPWCYQQLMAGRVLAVSSMDRLPAEAARDREVWQHFGIKTSLTLPLTAGGGPAIGFLSFNDIRKEREWSQGLLQQLQLVAQVFTNALVRRRSDDSLRESAEVNRATYEQAAVGIAHVGIDGRWLRVNDRLCGILGYLPEELMQLSFQDITYPDDLEADLDHVRQMLSGKIKTYSIEKRYIRKDRSLVWANLAVSLVRTERGEPKHFISVVEDISERKRTEEEMHRLRLQLWHADRVAQTGAITASLAHELNQPLTGILSTAQAGLRFLTAGPPNPTLIHEILTNIVHDTKRAGAVINGLRAMLRKKETQREPISLGETIQGVLDLAHSELIERHVEYEFAAPAPNLRVVADKAQIQQVLLNLVMNALEAMQNQRPEHRRLILTLRQTDSDEALVAVRDSGPGIPSDQQDKVFMAFWTTKQQGMGIGLAISYSIIESHGGRLWCANHPDGGAEFRFTLPLGRGEGPHE
jgi:PAS domain S-box-containing protein